jgi:hypothetical protein
MWPTPKSRENLAGKVVVYTNTDKANLKLLSLVDDIIVVLLTRVQERETYPSISKKGNT